MTEAQLALARRLVNHAKWRWVDAMMTYDGGRVEVDTDGFVARWEGYGADAERVPVRETAPDLTDYSTAAILLRMALEAGSADTDVHGDTLALGEHRGKDWGTVAAQALLECWGA